MHDKLGGAIAIQRAVPSPTPPALPKPPQATAPVLTGTQAKLTSASNLKQPAQPRSTLHQQPVPHSQAKAQTKPKTNPKAAPLKPQTEASQPAERQPHCIGDASPSDRPPLQLPVQESRRHRPRTAPPGDTVMQAPPFPYPILAGKPPKADLKVSGSIQQQAAAAGRDDGAQPDPQAGPRLKAAPLEAPRKGKTRSCGRAAAEKADDSSKGNEPPVADAAVVAPVNKGQLRRCGTCKNCMQLQSKKGCLVLKAARGQSQAPAAPPAPHAPAAPGKAEARQPAAAGPKAAQADPVAGPLAAKHKHSQASHAAKAAKQPKADKLERIPKSGAVRELLKPDEADVGGRSGAQAGTRAVASKPGRLGKAKGTQSSGGSKARQASSAPQGSIHSALTQAVELASSMEEEEEQEEPGAADQQQEAAQILDSLRTSPVGPLPGLRPASPKPSDAAGSDEGGQPGGEAGVGPSPDVSPFKRGRGRPRKERQPGDEEPQVVFGPKRARGRPRKSPMSPDSTSLADDSDLQSGVVYETAGVSSACAEGGVPSSSARAAQHLHKEDGTINTHPEVCLQWTAS